MILSLRWKIALNMWLMAAICALLSGLIGTWLVIKNYSTFLEQQLNATAVTLISLGLGDYSNAQEAQKLGSFVEEALHADKPSPIIHIFTAEHELLFSSLPERKSDFAHAFKSVEKPTFSLHQLGQKKYQSLTTPYKSKKGRQYYLQISIGYPPYRTLVMVTWWQAVALFALLSVLAFFISHFLANKIIRPVRDIALYLNTLNLSAIKTWQPLILSKPGEYLADIANGTNALITRIKNAIYSMSRTSRYLAHELRNPLTIMIGEAEAVLAKPSAHPEDYREVINSSLEEIARMDNVVSTVLKLFKKEKTLYNPSTCDLGAWLDEHVLRWKKYLGRDILWQRPEIPIVALIDTDLLYRLLDNFIRNIKAHTPAASPCTLRLTHANATKYISIEDSGPGLASEMITALNNRDVLYERLGIGLGLCLEIAFICNLKLSFKNKDGGGLVITIAME